MKSMLPGRVRREQQQLALANPQPASHEEGFAQSVGQGIVDPAQAQGAADLKYS